jgi:hypothetical protein
VSEGHLGAITAYSYRFSRSLQQKTADIASGESSAVINTVKPTKLSELIPTSSKTVISPTEADLSNFYRTFGPSVRSAYRYATSFKKYQMDIEREVSRLSADELMDSFVQTDSFDVGNSISHKLFLVKPDPDDHGNCIVTPVSTTIELMLFGFMKKHTIREILKEYDRFATHKGTRDLAGKLLEYLGHKIFSSRSSYKIRKASDVTHTEINTTYHLPAEPESTGWVIPDRRDQLLYSRAQVNQTIQGDLDFNTYYLPDTSNQPLFDSFVVDKHSQTEVITLVQVTLHKRHEMKLRFLQDIVQAAAARGISGKPTRTVRYILAYPDDGESRVCFHKVWSGSETVDVWMLAFDPHVLEKNVGYVAEYYL